MISVFLPWYAKSFPSEGFDIPPVVFSGMYFFLGKIVLIISLFSLLWMAPMLFLGKEFDLGIPTRKIQRNILLILGVCALLWILHLRFVISLFGIGFWIFLLGLLYVSHRFFQK